MFLWRNKKNNYSTGQRKVRSTSHFVRKINPFPINYACRLKVTRVGLASVLHDSLDASYIRFCG